jgi:hypothetical protein
MEEDMLDQLPIERREELVELLMATARELSARPSNRETPN